MNVGLNINKLYCDNRKTKELPDFIYGVKLYKGPTAGGQVGGVGRGGRFNPCQPTDRHADYNIADSIRRHFIRINYIFSIGNFGFMDVCIFNPRRKKRVVMSLTSISVCLRVYVCLCCRSSQMDGPI